MEKRVIIFFSVLLLFISCNTNLKDNNKDYTIKNFDVKDIPETLKINGKKLNFPQLINPRKILWDGNYLIVGELGLSDLLHIININDNEYIKIIGENGFGPGEITGVHKIQRDNASGVFWVYDMQQKIFAKYDVNSKDKLAVEQFKQSDELFIAVDMVWSSDTTLMTIRADGNEKFVEYHVNGTILNTYGTWDNMIDQKNIPSNVISSVHQGPLKSSPDYSKFVKVGVARDFVEILDKNSGKIISVRGPLSEIPEFKVDYSAGYPMAQFDISTRYTFYIDLILEKDFIYTLYFGNKSEKLLEGELAKTIMVFDYNGDIVRSYELDHSLLAFSVDEEGRRIFGITYDAEPNVVVFDF